MVSADIEKEERSEVNNLTVPQGIRRRANLT